MAGFFKNFLDSMRFSEEDDDYEEYLNEQEEKERKRLEKQNVPEQTYKVRESDMKHTVTEHVPQRNITQLEERRSTNRTPAEKPKVVQFRNSSYREELGLYVSKPKSFSECQDISDILVGGTAVVINLEGFDDEMAQRIMDFVSGTVYAINGTLNTIATRIYLVSPESVSISGDVETLLSQSVGGNAPTISKGF